MLPFQGAYRIIPFYTQGNALGSGGNALGSRV
jgi:hypothetical protein